MSEQTNQDLERMAADPEAAAETLEAPKPLGESATATATPYSVLGRPVAFDPLSILYVSLVLVGGLAGFLRKSSLPSLISSVIIAVVLAAAIYVEGLPARNAIPLIASYLALTLLMSYRFLVSPKFFPTGLIAAVSLVMLARHSLLYYRRRARR